MSETEDRLYGLMEIAERQQAAVQSALDGLVAERGALQREREMLAREVSRLGPGAQAAVRSAVRESLAGAATQGVEAVQVATRPLVGRLEGMTDAAVRAEDAMRRVVRWANWRLLGWVLAAAAALLLLGWLASAAVLWWEGGAIADARARKAELQGEIDGLQATQKAWVAAGMLGKLTRCGPGERPCIRVDEGAGAFGDRADYRVILGY